MNATRVDATLEQIERARPGPLRSLRLAGLSGPVKVAGDDRGVPTVEGAEHLDVVRVLGYLTARDRLFQMDLLRRQAAGRLSELLGAQTLEHDKRQRVIGFARVVPAVAAALPHEQRAVLEAYADGVNAYVAAGPLPFEFALLGTDPEPWRLEDSVLIAQLMVQLLADDGTVKRMIEVMRRSLPSAVVAFLLPGDDPYATDAAGLPAAAEPPPPPLEELVALMDESTQLGRPPRRIVADAQLRGGSNAWAVTGRRTVDGRAIIANDMHLHLSVPNIWYRVDLAYGDVRVEGVIIPGVPVVVAGSNGFVAWGATRLVGNTVDLVEIEIGDDGRRYRVADGLRPFTRVQERIAVRGCDPVAIDVEETVWGPLWGPPLDGRRLAVRWTAREPGGVDFALVELPAARDLDAACDVLNRSGAPPLNVILADRQGRIAWTVCGRFPDRRGRDAASLVRPGAGEQSWSGYLEPHRLPRILDSPTDLVVSANNLTPQHRPRGVIGLNGFGGGRASRIASLLRSRERLTELDLLGIQHDLDAEFYEFYRGLALDGVARTDLSRRPQLADVTAAIEAWNGTAAPDAVGLPFLVLFRELARESLFSCLLRRCLEADEQFEYVWHNHEGPLRQLLAAGVVPPPYRSFDHFVLNELELARRCLEHLSRGSPPSALTWGTLNRGGICHPLSAAYPALRGVLDRREDPLPGCADSVCVAWPGFGASLRMVVAPGRHCDGVLNVPGGQSGNPLEPTYDDQYDGWLRGIPSPFAAAKPSSSAVFSPA